MSRYQLISPYNTYVFSIRQHRRLSDVKTRTAELKELISEDQFVKTRAYGLDKSRFQFFSSTVAHAISVATLWFDFLPFLWFLSLRLCGDYLGLDGTLGNEIPHSLAFFILLYVWNLMTSLPFSLYSTFVIEQRHGFNNQTLGLFLMDLVKSTMLTIVIGFPVLSGFLWVIRATGEQFYFYVWLFFLAFQLIMLTIYPTLIQPLFNKVEPLPDGELKSKIELLAKSVNFPLSKLYVIDGSKRSNHSNAYFYGFFNNKHIVLFDTLIKQMDSDDQILAVLGHEIGHWHYSHTIRMLTISQLHMFLIFFTFSLVNNNEDIFKSFGFGKLVYLPTMISFMLFSQLISPFETLIGFGMNVLLRHHEFQADEFAQKLDMAPSLISGLLKLSVENKGMLWPDPWYSTWHHSHPPVVDRIKALGGIKLIQNKSAAEERSASPPFNARDQKEKYLFEQVLRKRN